MSQKNHDTFSARVKHALCEKTAQAFGILPHKNETAEDCCKLSFFSALLLFGTERREDTVVFTAKSEELADLFASSAAAFFSLTPNIIEGKPTLKYDAALQHVMRAANIDPYNPHSTLPIPVCFHCLNYFLRGVFLSAGTISDPEKAAQLNLFCHPHCESLLPLLHDAELPFRISTRREKQYLYLKKGMDISDFIGQIGAESFTLKLIEYDVEKSVRANINRKNNFDTANLSRSMTFLTRLDRAIRTLKERDATEALPARLKEIIRIRKQYPDADLAELGTHIHPPISKSGLHHRINKLLDLAEKKEH